VKPKLVIFDFDGTLADTFGWFLGVADALADRFRFRRIDPGDLHGLRGLNARQVLERQGVPLWKLPLIVRHGRALMARDIDRIPLFAGMTSALGRLAAGGASIAVVTSNSRANVLRVLGAKTAPLVSQLECGASLFGKASKLRRVLKRAGVLGPQALYVGDEIRDAEAARAAGVPFGAVSWGYTRLDALRAHTPARVFERVEDLADVTGGP
jgi:phosphoglycolate phosphatase